MFGCPTALDLALPAELQVRRIDGEALLLAGDWPLGDAPRRKAVADRLGETLAEAAASAGAAPLLVLVENADPLVGELDSLVPVFDRFAGDDRMLLFRCSAVITSLLPDDVPGELVFQPAASLRRLAQFSLQIVEA